MGYKIKICCSVCNIICFLILGAAIVNGYPTDKLEAKYQPEEQTLPNGTVVGKYAYLDKDGNPIQVKYYADESSYGVELNKVKVMPSNADNVFASTLPTQPTEPTEKNENGIENSERGNKENQYDILESIKYNPNKNHKVIEPLDFLNKETTKSCNEKVKTKNPEYEIFMQNDLASNRHCNTGNGKIRVYNRYKEARKVRKVKVDEEPKFCIQY